MTRKAKAVLLSDVHFTVPTLELASSALIQSLDKAEELSVPLIICGDLLDSKAIIRGECANRLIDILGRYHGKVFKYIMVGNHDLLNEKGDAHSLNFLAPYAEIISLPTYLPKIGYWAIPYQNNSEALQALLLEIQKKGDTHLLLHQGVIGAAMGHYTVDKTSLNSDSFSYFRCISGHYHRAQDIKTGRPRKGAVGLFSYIGSPYTTSFAEAEDGPKGFQVLFDDGLMEQVPTNLRKHIILNMTIEENGLHQDKTVLINKEDLVWMKFTGPSSELDKLNKREIGMAFLGHSNYKFDKIYADTVKPKQDIEKMSEEAIFDSVIDNIDDLPDNKTYLKALWREIL